MMNSTLASIVSALSNLAGDTVEVSNVALHRFNGKGSIREWMRDYKAAASGAGWTATQKLTRLPLFFGPEPKEAYQTAAASALQRQDIIGFDTRNFEGMSKYLIDIFSAGDDVSECEKALDSLRQTPGQSVTSFYLKLKGALRNAKDVFEQRNVEDHVTDMKRQQKKLFMRGLLDPQMRMWVEERDPEGLEAAWILAKKHERIYGGSTDPRAPSEVSTRPMSRSAKPPPPLRRGMWRF